MAATSWEEVIRRAKELGTRKGHDVRVEQNVRQMWEGVKNALESRSYMEINFLDLFQFKVNRYEFIGYYESVRKKVKEGDESLKEQLQRMTPLYEALHYTYAKHFHQKYPHNTINRIRYYKGKGSSAELKTYLRNVDKEMLAKITADASKGVPRIKDSIVTKEGFFYIQFMNKVKKQVVEKPIETDEGVYNKTD